MDLNTLWFILIAVLFIGFFFLEGFDYGVGILLPFVAKTDDERRVAINSIGPFWDGNEVWLLTAGGAMFAAFPNWYATLFSGFYLALALILLALIVRGVAFEFRSKDENPKWRQLWDWAIFVGSLLPALLFGVAFGNIIRGVAIDSSMTYVGSFFDLLNPFALVAGVTTLIIFTLHGALFLSLKTEGIVEQRAKALAQRLTLPVIGVALLFAVLSYFATGIFRAPLAAIALVLGAVALVAGWYFVRGNRWGRAFISNGLAIALVAISMFGSLFPRVMISTLGAENDLTIYNASSSPYTLQIMTIIALTLVPVVLAYQGWTYWVFRKRVGGAKAHLEY